MKPCCGIKEWDTLESKYFNLCKAKEWSMVCLVTIYKLIFLNISLWETNVGSHLTLQGKNEF